MKQLNVSLAALIAAAALPAFAQDIALDEIVVSANLEATEASRTGVTVEVVDEAALEATAETRVTDYLNRLPGVAVRTTGPMGTQAGITLRGVPQTGIAVRVDGIDVSDPSGPQVVYDLGGLTSVGISRIEVVKGSQSALYGSEAIGGAINITTLRATENGVRHDVALEYGSFDTLRASYGFAAKSDSADIALTLSRVQSEGYSAGDEADGNTEADGFEATRLSFAGGYAFDGGARLDVAGFVERSWFEFDESSAAGVVDGTPDEIEAKTSRGLRTALQFSGAGIDHTLEYAFFDSNRRNDSGGAFGPFRIDFVGRRNTFAYQGAADVGASGRLVFGAEQVTESYADASAFGGQSHDTTTRSLYAEYSLAVTEAVDITATGRIDDHSRFGSFNTARLSAVWRLREDLTLRANLANGFRAPSNYELFDAFSGDPTLQPETSLSYDIGLQKTVGDSGTFGIALFRVETEDLIDYSYTTFTYVQRPGTARRQGIELTGEWDFAGGVTLAGNYTYTESQTTAVLDASSWSVDVPRHMLGLTLEVPVTGSLGAAVTLQHGAGRAAMADYTVVNATLTQDFGQDTEAYLRVENLFDEQYQLVPGYGTSDRAFYLGLRKSF